NFCNKHLGFDSLMKRDNACCPYRHSAVHYVLPVATILLELHHTSWCWDVTRGLNHHDITECPPDYMEPFGRFHRGGYRRRWIYKPHAQPAIRKQVIHKYSAH